MPAGAAISSSSRNRKGSKNKKSRRSMMQDNQRNSSRGGSMSQRNLLEGSMRNLSIPVDTPRERDLADSMPTLYEGRKKELEQIKRTLDSSTKSNPELYSPSRGGSMRNLSRAVNMARERDLADSMPTLYERQKKELEQIKRTLNSSTKSNPELYIHLGGLEPQTQICDSGSGSIELRQRKSQNSEAEEGGSQNPKEWESRYNISQGNNVAQGESAPSQNNHSPKSKSHPSLKDKDSFIENNNAVESTTPRESYQLPPYLVPFNQARKIIGTIINDDRIQNTVLLLIVINAVMMGIATFPAVKENPNVLRKFELADKVFLILFTIESAMQLIYHDWKLFMDGFLVFDLLIVVMSWALVGAQVFRAFRIFRAMRLITRIDVLKNLVSALFSVVPKMTAIFMLLMLIFYIFAVMFTQLFKNMDDNDQPYFDSLHGSLFTLFQMMTLDEWAEILIETQETYSYAWIPFVGYIVITGFVIVNLMIAVICDAVHVLGNEDKEGLQGYGSEDFSGSSQSNLFEGDVNQNNATGTEYRLEQLQQHLDDMVMVQEKMRSTIEILIAQLQESAARKSASTSIETDDGEEKSQFRPCSVTPTDSPMGGQISVTPTDSLLGGSVTPTDSLPGGQISRCTTWPIPTDSGGQSIGPKSM